MAKKNLVGQLLVANPLNPKDGLDHAVILIVSNSSSTSIGLQLNTPAEDLKLSAVFEQLGMFYDGTESVYHGGNLSQGKIHIIHSPDWEGMTTVRLNDQISVTNDISILTAINAGEGPEFFRACAGYWTWEDGILDRQLNPKSNSKYRWEIAPATTETVFEFDELGQWHRAVEESARSQVNFWF